MDIRLELPAPEHEAGASDFVGEFFAHNEPEIHGSSLLENMPYSAWLSHTTLGRDPETASKDWVPATTFFAVRRGDGKIVGMIDIRHTLNNPHLRDYGGHIGYSVRPSERRKGYATQMLKLALGFAKTLGLERVMLGCDTDNTASNRTILRCGGTLTQTKPYTDGMPMNVYWINIM